VKHVSGVVVKEKRCDRPSPHKFCNRRVVEKFLCRKNICQKCTIWIRETSISWKWKSIEISSTRNLLGRKFAICCPVYFLTFDAAETNWDNFYSVHADMCRVTSEFSNRLNDILRVEDVSATRQDFWRVPLSLTWHSLKLRAWPDCWMHGERERAVLLPGAFTNRGRSQSKWKK